MNTSTGQSKTTTHSPSSLHRRAFIKTVGAGVIGAAASSLFPSNLRGAVEAVSKPLNVACIGLGGIMQNDLPAAAGIPGVRIVAVCDLDRRAFERTRKNLSKIQDVKVRACLNGAKEYTDFRQLLKEEQSLDAVIIATPDHWHAPICTAAIKAGKHVYCEKPLTHTIGEARKLRELVKTSKVVTQMGNQGSASSNLRRNIELIQAGLLGQVHEVHIWHPPYSTNFCGSERPPGEDPVPEGFDWDFWVGPAPMRPYKNNAYHPFAWRYWYDFGNGSLGDFCGHAFNLPVRALRLEYPSAVDVAAKALGKESYITEGRITYEFPARANLAAVKMHFYHAQLPPPELLKGFAASFGEAPATGCLLLGEEGEISAGLWNSEGYLRLKGEEKFKGIMSHAAAKNIPVTLPRVRSHMEEWVNACRGNGTTFSNFETGGHLTEVGLAGIVALRLGHRIDWDGPAMKVPGNPEADRLIHAEYRAKWLNDTQVF